VRTRITLENLVHNIAFEVERRLENTNGSGDDDDDDDDDDEEDDEAEVEE
jgi:hypothetical protein